MARTYAAYYDDFAMPGSPFEDGEVLLWYDGPRLLWFHTADGRCILIEAAAETEDGYLELGVYLPEEELHKYVNGELPLRDAWTTAQPGEVYAIRTRYNGENEIRTAVPYLDHLTDDLLPQAGSKLKARSA